MSGGVVLGMVLSVGVRGRGGLGSGLGVYGLVFEVECRIRDVEWHVLTLPKPNQPK